MSRRDEILDVAERLLRTQGPAAVTMRRVADEMGIRQLPARSRRWCFAGWPLGD